MVFPTPGLPWHQKMPLSPIGRLRCRHDRNSLVSGTIDVSLEHVQHDTVHGNHLAARELQHVRKFDRPLYLVLPTMEGGG